MNIAYSEEGMSINGTLITWDEIDEKRDAIRFADYVLVSIVWQMRRSSDVDSHYIMPKSEWEWWKKRIIGANIYFGEIDGKHSEVYGIVEESDVTVSFDLDKIKYFNKAHGKSSGRVDFLGQYVTNVCDDGSIEDAEVKEKYS